MTPAAILIGSVIIAAGLYFGVQRSAAPPRAPVVEASSPVPVPVPAAAPSVVMAQVGTTAQTALRRRVEADALKALEARRAEFVARCWEPSRRKNPSPPVAKYVFAMSFDESGKEIARGISEVRGMDRPDAAQCLRMLPLGIDVPAPGVHLGIEVPMLLP